MKLNSVISEMDRRKFLGFLGKGAAGAVSSASLNNPIVKIAKKFGTSPLGVLKGLAASYAKNDFGKNLFYGLNTAIIDNGESLRVLVNPKTEEAEYLKLVYSEYLVDHDNRIWDDKMLSRMKDAKDANPFKDLVAFKIPLDDKTKIWMKKAYIDDAVERLKNGSMFKSDGDLPGSYTPFESFSRAFGNEEYEKLNRIAAGRAYGSVEEFISSGIENGESIYELSSRYSWIDNDFWKTTAGSGHKFIEVMKRNLTKHAPQHAEKIEEISNKATENLNSRRKSESPKEEDEPQNQEKPSVPDEHKDWLMDRFTRVESLEDRLNAILLEEDELEVEETQFTDKSDEDNPAEFLTAEGDGVITPKSKVRFPNSGRMSGRTNKSAQAAIR